MSTFEVRQEVEEVDGRRLLRVAAAAFSIGAVAVFLSGLLLLAGGGTLLPAPDERERARPVGRTLGGVEQTPIWLARPGLDDAQTARAELSKWGWVNRDAGLAILPIDRAIDLVLDEAAR